MSKALYIPYWLDRAYCVEAANEDEAKRIYAELKNRVPRTCQPIPYPSNPRPSAADKERNETDYDCSAECVDC